MPLLDKLKGIYKVQECNTDCYDKCQRNIYKDNNKCILHCKKNDYSKDLDSNLLSDFYDEFIKYIITNLFKHTDLLENKLNKENLKSYLKSNKYDNEEYNNILKNTIFTPSCIHFSTRDERDTFDYLKILNLFGQIHFNYCEFYLSSLNLENVECFFQDCKFHTDWILYNYGILENQDNVTYQTCEFNKGVSNYIPDKQKELAVYKYSQFDYTCTFHSNIEFDRCKFKDMLFNTNQNNYLEENILEQIIFENCIFDSKFKLNNFQIQTFKIINTIFKNKFEFKENILGELLIDNSNFEKIVDLFGSKFKRFKIYKSIFDDFVGFENCQFGTDNKLREEISIFKYATFLDFINFRNTNFKSGLDIENINIKEAPNFLNMSIEFKNTNRETFRIIKHSFDKINNNIEANKYFIEEMKKYKEDLKKKSLKGNIQEKIVFNLNDTISSFGQSYLKPILLLIGFVIIYNFIVYGYEQNWLYKIYPPANHYIQSFTDLFNNIAKNILPFAKFLKEDLEFLSLLFYIIFSILIWQIIVSIKRYTKR
jgi:hypothetical protein